MEKRQGEMKLNDFNTTIDQAEYVSGAGHAD
jgi:hypothetical protein